MTIALSSTHSDDAFFRKRKAMLVFPWIVLPFVFALFWILGGGKGERYKAEEIAAGKPGAGGFNANVPNAKTGKINGRDVEGPGYGKAAVGQVLSSFSHTRRDSATGELKAIPVNNAGTPTEHRSRLAAAATPVSDPGTTRSYSSVPTKRVSNRKRAEKPGAYYYDAPKGSTYYTGTDKQLESQLRTYETSRQTPPPNPYATQASMVQPVQAGSEDNAAAVRLSDNLTASRLSDPVEAESPFLTAPTGGTRKEPSRAVLSGGNYGQKKVIAWMIPVVVHEDQAIHDGQQVKLRLLKEITADGVTIPANTILHAICQLSDDRLRLTVRSLQLGGQLIPLDLDVYDTDGSMGVNVPGLSRQASGQIQSSAIQGLQLPGVGGLVNNVANQARMSASNSVRQTTIRLRAGYNLFLKAQ